MGIRSVRRTRSEAVGPIYRYGTLAFLLALIASNVRWHLTLPPAYDGDRYGVSLVILLLLLNHLSGEFKWPKRVGLVLEVVSVIWMVFTLFYVFYLGEVLYPIQASQHV